MCRLVMIGKSGGLLMTEDNSGTGRAGGLRCDIVIEGQRRMRHLATRLLYDDDVGGLESLDRTLCRSVGP